MTEYNLYFMHPQYGTTMNVDIDGEFTVEEMINNLLLTGFIEEHDTGYNMSLMGEQLDREASFNEIQELYDGAIIKIVANQANAPIEVIPNSKSQVFHIRHPHDSLVLSTKLKSNLPLSHLVQEATDKNFVAGENDILHLQKGSKLLDLNKTAAENGISSGDYLELINGKSNEDKNPMESVISQLNEKFTDLEQNIQDELVNIKEALPAANMIPIDPTRAVNPTMEVYESIDTIVNRLRKESNEAPIRPIRQVNINLLVLIVCGAIILSLILLKGFNII